MEGARRRRMRRRRARRCSASRASASGSGSSRSCAASTSRSTRGEVVCVLGPSGSGKSTLLRCINLLEPPEAGRILLEGQEITGAGAAEGVDYVRQRVGMVFQQFNLFPHKCALDNVALAQEKVLDRCAEEATGEGAGAARAGRAGRQGRRVPRPALGRTAAAGRDRPGAGDGPARDAVRRGHLGARPGAGQGGARRDARARRRGDDDDRRHARDRLRPRGRDAGSCSWTAAWWSSRARPRRCSTTRSRSGRSAFSGSCWSTERGRRGDHLAILRTRVGTPSGSRCKQSTAAGPPLIHSTASTARSRTCARWSSRCLEAAGARSVAEIGAEHGLFTSELLAWSERNGGGQISAIDPAPRQRLRELAERASGARADRRDQPRRAAAARAPDAVIVDGDHNYFTVHEELLAIDRKAGGRPAAARAPARHRLAAGAPRQLPRPRPDPGRAPPAARRARLPRPRRSRARRARPLLRARSRPRRAAPATAS